MIKMCIITGGGRMLKAEKLETYKKGKFRPGYASIKHNGIHGTSDVMEGIIYSRTPKVIQGLGHILKDLAKIPFNVQGEIVVPDMHFQTASGLIRSSNDTPGALFYIFNILGKDVSRKFAERLTIHRYIHSTFYGADSPIRFVDFIKIDTEKEYDEFHIATIEAGYEGTCLIVPDHINQPGKRTWDWMKRVPYKSIEVQVISINSGTKGKKYEHSLGSFQCQMDDGKKVKVGIFKEQTDEWRQFVYDNPGKFLREFITIEYKDLSIKGIPTQPRFKAVRWDLSCI